MAWTFFLAASSTNATVLSVECFLILAASSFVASASKWVWTRPQRTTQDMLILLEWGPAEWVGKGRFERAYCYRGRCVKCGRARRNGRVRGGTIGYHPARDRGPCCHRHRSPKAR